MLYWSVIFFIIAMVSAILGFGGISAASASIAVWLFWLSIIIFVVTLIWGIIKRLKK